MSSHEVFVAQFERLFHHYEAALCHTSPEKSESQTHGGNPVAADDRSRMVAAARLAILEIETNSQMEENSRKYFAKPGEAEWGC